MIQLKLLSIARLAVLVFMGAFAAISSVAWAASVTVINAGFEDISGENPFNEFTFGELNGWSLYDPGSIAGSGAGETYYIGTLTPVEIDPDNNPGIYANFPDGAAEGERVGIAFNFNDSGGQGEYGMVQQLEATLQPQMTYTLEVEIGNIDSGIAESGETFLLEGFTGYRIELRAGGEMLAQDDNSLSGTIPDGEFGTSTVSFTTGAAHDQLGEELSIVLIHLNQIDAEFPDSHLEVDFDNIRLDASSQILAGDFDLDGDVDGADFLQWQREADSSVNAATELTAWQINYGNSTSSSAITSIPEPATATLLTLSLLLASSPAHKKTRRCYEATTR